LKTFLILIIDNLKVIERVYDDVVVFAKASQNLAR